MGVHKTVNGAYRYRYAPFLISTYYVMGCSPLALPLGELSPKVTERVCKRFGDSLPTAIRSNLLAVSLRASRRLAQQSASSSPGPLRAAGPTGRFGDFSVPQPELLLVKSALFAAQFTRHARYTTKKERHLDGCS